VPAHLIIREIYGRFHSTLLHDRMGQQTRLANEILVVDCESSGIIREGDVVWTAVIRQLCIVNCLLYLPNDRLSVQTSVEKGGVPSW
jgi:hypothetical protein